MTTSVRAGRRSIDITHADRLVFPRAGLTKLDLARHYAAVAPAMVPHVRDRPLALQSFPQGIEGQGHFLKNAPRHFPDWIRTAQVPKREGGVLRQVLANDAATLVYLAGQNAVTPHIWTARADRLEQPDRVVFDLDPANSRFAEVRAAARALGDLLRDLGFEPFAMTTGSRGLHVVIALRRGPDYAAVNAWAREVGAQFAATVPKRLTTEFRIAKRGGRLFVDMHRNAYAQHAVAPYAVRALSQAPVATPLRWEELSDRRLRPQGWTMKTIQDRLAERGDPWKGIARTARRLPAASRPRG
ncbi:MAG: non-homologous end-joining DNA ligase [Solirubrobacteraceae bacterium]